MRAAQLREALEDIARMPGLDGCALVEIEAGMAWHAIGDMEELQQIAEAASDYWRLYQRGQRYFERIGELRAQVMMHRNGRITMLPCTHGMLLVALSREIEPVDWSALQKKALNLQPLLGDL
jgi:broad specificity phosphatase PhoE